MILMYIKKPRKGTALHVQRQYACKRDSVLSTQSFAYLIHASAWYASPNRLLDEAEALTH